MFTQKSSGFVVRFFILVALVCQTVIPTVGAAQSLYGYQTDNPAFSTLSAILINGQPQGYITYSIPARGRKIRGLRRYENLKLGFAPILPRASSAGSEGYDLVVILSGLGSDSRSNISKFLAKSVQEAGAAALVLPNTFTPNFVVAASETGLVGAVDQDIWDLMLVLENAIKGLIDNGHEFRSINILGYSHGALLAAFLHARGFKINGVPVRSYLLVNPPVDLLYGLRTLDGHLDQIGKMSFSRLLNIGLNLKNKLRDLRQESVSTQTHASFVQFLQQKLKLSTEEAYGLIAKGMAYPLRGVILASQGIRDQGILPEPGLEGSVVRQQQDSARRRAAGRYGFEEYVKTFFPALYGRGSEGVGRAGRDGSFSIEKLGDENSMVALEQDLAKSSNIYLVHNADDFLLRRSDLDWLNQVFGPRRARFYPRGGHMGNLWWDDNVLLLRDWVRTGQF